MPLALAQAFFHKDGVASIATVKLKRKEDKVAFKAKVERHWEGLIALENEEFSRSYSQFRILKSTAWAVGGCAFLLGGLSVANTMIMSVFTRIREMAILRVCGFSRWQIAGLIFGESSVLAGSSDLQSPFEICADPNSCRRTFGRCPLTTAGIYGR
jgi:putative ABC transport system permease protein